MGLIRLLLALSVVTAHSNAIFGCSLVGGSIAVQAFFIISGFYMSVILNEKYVGKNGSFRLFITNRFLRIYPIYWTVMLCTIIFVLGIAVTNGVPKGQIIDNYSSIKNHPFPFTYLILNNLLIFGQDVAMFLGLNPESGTLFFTNHFQDSHPPVYSFLLVPQAWTLGLELTFYLLAPFILRKGVKTVVTLIILSFLLRLTLYDCFQLKYDPWTVRFFPTELMFFLLGYLSYRIYLILRVKKVPPYVGVFSLASCVVFTVLFNFLPAVSFRWFPFSVKEILYFSMIIVSIPILFNYLKNNKLDSKIGELSYPVYIVHLLVIGIVGGFGHKYSKAFLMTGAAYALASIIAAYFLNVAIALPIEKFRQARLKK